MNLDDITVIVLTYNEEANISRTLEKINWARDIVVVDGLSNDQTPARARQVPQVRLFQQCFDSLADKWNFALKETGVKTEWVLAMDADYGITGEFVERLKDLNPAADEAGFSSSFVYCVFGKPLRGALYPPITVLYRKDKAHYVQDGHAYRVRIEGIVRPLKASILHDDRKPLSRWLSNQVEYANLETEKIANTPWRDLSWPDRLRSMKIIAPWLVLIYCLFFKGLILDGVPGLYYSFQRVLAELILSVHLLDHDLQKLFPQAAAPSEPGKQAGPGNKKGPE